MNEQLNRDKLTPSEALYGFAGWVTSRKEIVSAGSTEDASIWAYLVKEFCKANDLPEPRERWSDLLKHPKD